MNENWQIVTDFKMYYDMVIRQEIPDAYNDIIDFELFTKMLVKEGWHMIVVDMSSTVVDLTEVAEWTKNNTKGQYITLHSKYLFKLEADATWFFLKWGKQ